MERPIAVVEPQMTGLFHAPFNAAFLHAVVLAYPAAAVSFAGFPGHLEVVRGILRQYAPDLEARIVWREETPPPGKASLWTRWRKSSRMLRKYLDSGDRVVFCSVSRMQLLQLKRMMRPEHSIRAVIHGDIEALLNPSADRFPRNLFSVPRILLLPHPPGFRYIFLSASIRENIPPQFQPCVANCGVIEHPYHFQPFPPPQDLGSLIFGIFGNSGEGRLFEEVSRAVKEKKPSILFRMVGFLGSLDAVERLKPYIEYASVKHVDRQTFIERARSVTHMLWLSSPGDFRLRASGTFLDALLYGKPIVYTANPYIDRYYALEPGIGVRCETLAEVPNTVVSLSSTLTPQSYADSQAAILRLRALFTPEAVARILPKALDWDSA